MQVTSAAAVRQPTPLFLSLSLARSDCPFRPGSGQALRVGVEGSRELLLDTPASVSVIWHGESGCPDASNFDFDVSRITKNHKKSL